MYMLLAVVVLLKWDTEYEATDYDTGVEWLDWSSVAGFDIVLASWQWYHVAVWSEGKTPFDPIEPGY